MEEFLIVVSGIFSGPLYIRECIYGIYNTPLSSKIIGTLDEWMDGQIYKLLNRFQQGNEAAQLCTMSSTEWFDKHAPL